MTPSFIKCHPFVLIACLALFSLPGCFSSSSSGDSSGSRTDTTQESDATEGDDVEALPRASARAIGFTDSVLGPEEGALLITWELAEDATVDICVAAERVRLPDNCALYNESHWLPSVSGSSVVVEGLDPTLVYHAAISRDGETITTESSARPAASPLNVTGIDWCAAIDENFLDCPAGNGDLPGQDGETIHYGNTSDSGSNTSWAKLGAGPGAFDFTKLDEFGNTLPADAGSWECVRDNRTGLVWEVKSSEPERFNYRGHTYSWYMSAQDGNGGNAGVADGGECSGSDCDTASYAAAMRNDYRCAVNDWRVPTAAELTSIMNYGDASVPLWIPEALPDEVGDSLWTATPDAADSGQAWAVSPDAVVTGAAKATDYPVRLVSSGPWSPQFVDDGAPGCDGNIPASAPDSAFWHADTDATTLHQATGLEWSRCVLGQIWDADAESCVGDAETHNWPSALRAVQTQNDDMLYEGHDDWRLPNIHELRSVVENRCNNPAINSGVFPDTPANRAWTSSPSALDPKEALIVDFSTGADLRVRKASGGHVRMVRNAETVLENDTVVIAASLDGVEFAIGDDITAIGSLYNAGDTESYSEFNLLATNTEDNTTQVLGSTVFDGLGPGFYHLGALSITGSLAEIGTYDLAIENRATGQTRDAGTAEVYEVAVQVIAASVADIELAVGETTEVIGSIHFPGPVGGEQTVSMTVNGAPHLSTTVTGDAGYYHLGAINFPFSADEAGTYEIELAGVNADGTPNSRSAGTVEVTED